MWPRLVGWLVGAFETERDFRITRPAASPIARLGLGILVVLPSMLLWSFKDAAFVADDRWFATGQLVEHYTDLLTATWPHPFGPTHAYRPLIVLSYLLTRALTSGTPHVYHLTNFLFHGLNAALLAALVVRLTRSTRAALIAGALFAIHPITHENVLWISGRTYVIAATFGLALLVWTATADRRGWLLQHAVGSVLLVSALVSYELAITVPAMVALLALWLAYRARQPLTGAVRSIGVYASVTLAYLLFRWLYISSPGGDLFVSLHGTTPHWGTTRALRRGLANVTMMTARLLDGNGMTFPVPSDRIGIVLALMLLAGAVVSLVKARGLRAPALGMIAMGALAFAPVALGPAYTDRLIYMSAAAFAAFIAMGWEAWFRRSRPVWLRAGVVVLLACVGVWWAAQDRSRGREWLHAGEIAESLLDQLQRLEPAPARGASLHVAGVPAVYRSACVFITYFHHSVRTRYGREDLDVVAYAEPPNARVIEEVRSCAAGRTQGDARRVGSCRLFWWDQTTERLIPINVNVPSALGDDSRVAGGP